MGGGRESSQIHRITFQPSRSNTPLTSWAWERHCIPETFKGANLAFTDPLMHPSDASLLHPCTDSLCFTHSFTTLSADSFKNGLTSPPVFSFPGTLIYVTVHPLFSSFSFLGSDPVLGISTWVTQSSSTQRGTSDVDREVS